MRKIYSSSVEIVVIDMSAETVMMANLDLYDLDLDLWQYSLDRKKII